MNNFLKQTSVYISEGYSHQGEPIVVRIEIYFDGQLYIAKMYFHEYVNLKIASPIKVEGFENGDVSAELIISDDFLTNRPKPLLADSESDLLELVEERLAQNGYQKD